MSEPNPTNRRSRPIDGVAPSTRRSPSAPVRPAAATTATRPAARPATKPVAKPAPAPQPRTPKPAEAQATIPHPEAPIVLPTRRPKRRRFIWVIVVLVILAAVGAGGWYIYVNFLR